METIRQRIERQMREFSKSHPTKDGNLLQLREDAVNFIVPACEEQQEIDIQKAIKWHCDTCKKYMSCTGKDKCYVPTELTKAMKGE